MSVEIVILSGTRQGERFRVEDTVFQAGDRPTDAVAFDPEKDAGCRGRRLVFRLEAEGWRVQNSGSVPVILNQEELGTERTVRSGDIVRLSEEGPDFSFNLIGQDASPTGLGEPPVIASGSAPDAVWDHRKTMWPVAVLVILIGAFLVALAVKWVRRPSLPDVQTAASTDTADPSQDGTDPVSEMPNDKPSLAASISPESVPLSVEPDATPKVKASATEMPATSQTGTVYLLAVEHPTTKTMYPYGSACAIRDDTLMTSASLAVELQKRKAAGWRVLAALPDEFPQLATASREVTSVQVHQAYQTLRETPVEQIFFDLALLSVNRTMDTYLELADSADLSRLESGQPLDCLGIPHDGERLTRFEYPSEKSESAKIFFVMPFPDSGGLGDMGAPSLLHLEGKLPENMFGSPVLSRENKVIGVYAERAALPPDMGEIELHYAAMVTFVNAWMSGEGRQHWVTPTPSEKPDGEKE